MALRQIMFSENPSAWGMPADHHWKLSWNQFLGRPDDQNLICWAVGEELLKSLNRSNHLSAGSVRSESLARSYPFPHRPHPHERLASPLA